MPARNMMEENTRGESDVYTEQEIEAASPVDGLQPTDEFVETPYIRELTQRALDYIHIGFPVNFEGPAGVGKTTLAFYAASKLGRPVALLYGDHQFNSSDLVGSFYGYHKKSVRDNFIRSVTKVDETMNTHWADNQLTTACQYGYTLIYDEFTRSRPEANNVLLSVLEERILPLPTLRCKENYLKVHPDFSVIFTSNPVEYAGVYKTQDALYDRMVTIEVGNFDEETEVRITQVKSGVSVASAQWIVSLVRRVREAKENKYTPTVRASIALAKMLKLRGENLLQSNDAFERTCIDILLPEVPHQEKEKVRQLIHATLSLSTRREALYG